ncbi:MAG: UDP-N-acetylmuramoyl-L-alanine--D-glutamate ligase, partial [bacterium]
SGETIKLGAERVGEVELAFRWLKGRVIAITGTKGKSTTTTLTGRMLEQAGFTVAVGGNIGQPISAQVDASTAQTLHVVEVSSFQLHDIEKFKPKVAVLMNITPDHIDWHGNFNNYLKSKLEIIKNQDEEDLTVINYDDDILRKSTKGIKSQSSYFSIKEDLSEVTEAGSFIKKGKIIYFDKAKDITEEIMETREINIRGNHNLYNSLAAVISARAFQIKKEIIAETLRKFPGVEHRIEFVRELNGIKFYNDSKATNIDSLIVALESFEGNVILILGGREKGNDYSRIDALVNDRVKKIIAIGESRVKIYDHYKGKKEIETAETFEDAVRKSYKSGMKGDSVLLSPACKSFDMFDNFEHRGLEFKKFVNKLN